MSNKMIQEPEDAATSMTPKTMTNADIWLKMLADQKLIREELQKGTTFQELREKYGFVFKTK